MNAQTDNSPAGFWKGPWSDWQGFSLRHPHLLKRVRSFGAALLLGGLATGFTGCAGPYYPNYSPYYGDYGYYDGAYPFGGFAGDIFIGGVHHHGYYGGHHFGHDFHGGFGGHGFRGGGFHGGGHGGGGHR